MRSPDFDEWGTPAGLYAALDQEFGFTVDACAAPWNAKHERFWSRDDSALKHSWRGERVWCNPPYSYPLPFVDKAREADLAVLLLPLWGRQSFLGYALEHSKEFRRLGQIAFVGRYTDNQSPAPWEAGLFIFGSAIDAGCWGS